MLVSDDLLSEEGLRRRVAMRDSSGRVTRRTRCRRCGGAIPETRRADAKDCSRRCTEAYHAARQYALRREILLYLRSLKVRERCDCGAALDTTVRKGRVPQQCKRCYARDYQRRRRAALRQKGGINASQS